MNSLLAVLISLLAPAASAPAAPASAPAAPVSAVNDAAGVMAGVQRFYQSTTDFKAKFTQTYVYKVYGRSQVSVGNVFFKKPGRMRWDYVTPVPKLFLSDGATLWVYEPQESQAFKRSLSSTQLPVALTFMSGQGRLEDEFAGALLQSSDGKSYLLQLTPKKNAGDYQSLRLKVDRSTFAVTASTVVDPVGNTNTVEFSNFETNKGLPEKGFQFVPPAGVKVIDDPRGGGAP